MAAAYPTHALSSSGAVGWRGLVTHTRGGAVRVFGSWFRLADQRFVTPIRPPEGESPTQPERAPSPASTSQASGQPDVGNGAARRRGTLGYWAEYWAAQQQTAIGVGSRVQDSEGTCGEIVARSGPWLQP